MRDLRPLPHALYAAHTAGRNSFAIGLALCGMADATPGDFGAYPLTEPLIAGLCEVAARLAVAYNIPLDAIRTHAEAAVEERYFGAGDDERWDIARLRASSAPLREEEAQIVGDALRSRIAMRLAERREA